jgi:hypothetical protein
MTWANRSGASRLRRAAAVVVVCAPVAAAAGGGLLGIDSPSHGDATGIFNRHNQLVLQDASALFVVASALWEAATRASAARHGRQPIRSFWASPPAA